INCQDPDVFHLLMKSAMEQFDDIIIYRFRKPVEGNTDRSCHMAWSFRPKDATAGFDQQDYRSFTIAKADDRKQLIVAGIGGYHSGINAKTTDPDVGFPEGKSFSEGKYLIYSGGGDRCKSMDHYMWSFTCMLGEAQYLNRTLVMDMGVCLNRMYTSSGQDEEGKDFRLYFDFEHLLDSTQVMDQVEFWYQWRRQRRGLSRHDVQGSRITPMKLAEINDTLIMRKLGSVEPDNYRYRVCEGEAESVVRRPWNMFWKSRRLLDIASAIAARMKWDFDAVLLHVNITGGGILSALRSRRIEEGRDVYIAATYEKKKPFSSTLFDPLKGKYSIHFLDEFKDLWDSNSDWYRDGHDPAVPVVSFDGYMRMSVDIEVFYRAKNQID
ncbi:hypothetical protein M569_04249, partial [Genlisea aurea]